MEAGVCTGEVTKMAIPERQCRFFHCGIFLTQQPLRLAHLDLKKCTPRREPGGLAEKPVQPHGGHSEIVSQRGGGCPDLEMPPHPLLGQLQALLDTHLRVGGTPVAAGQCGIEKDFQASSEGGENSSERWISRRVR